MEENKEKYKVIYCKITENKCTRQYCTDCTFGKEELESELKNYNEITTFTSKNRNGIIFKVNLINTIAKSDSIDNLHLVLDKNNDWFINLEPLNDFSSDILIKSYPHYVIVVEALHLSTATKYYYLKDLPLISVHGNVVLATAPRIEE